MVFVVVLCFRLLRYVLTMVVRIVHVCSDLYVVYSFGNCNDACGLVECSLFLESGCCVLCCYVA